MKVSLLVLAAVLGSLQYCRLATAVEYILYDFESNKDHNGVKDFFKDVTLRTSYKLYGAPRYIMLVENDQSAGLKALKLPDDARNIKAVPMEIVNDYFKHFDADYTPDVSVRRLDDKDLGFVVRTWNFKGTHEELTTLNQNLARSATPSSFNRTILVQAARIPITFYCFMNKNDHDIFGKFLDKTKIMGGPDAIQLEMVKIFNI